MTAMHKSLWNIPRHPGVLCVIALLGTFAAGMLPAGTIIHVDPDAPGSGTGSDWTNATTSLSDALASALDGDEIWVRAGTYTPAPSNALRETTFTLKTGVALYGGFSGSETNRDARDPELNRTVLSGDLNGDDGDAVNGPWADMGENAYHVVTATNVADAVLDGFTITRGWSWQATGWNSGGAGLLVIESGITFLNCTVTGNMAHSGSGMYLYDSPASISNCTFSGNWAVDGRGGAIYHRAADYEVPVTVTIRASRFLNNVAMPGGGPGDAGAIWCSFSSPLDIDGCLFEGNEARWRFTYGSMAAGGGAMIVFGSGTRIANTVFRGNRAHMGGALWIGSDVNIVNCLFVKNEAFRQSVGFYDYGGYAGAIYAPGSGRSRTVDIANCTFHENLARSYGGVWAGSDTTIRNSILWSNRSTEEEARLLDMQIGGTPNLRYSLVRGLFEPIPGEQAPDPAGFNGCLDQDPILVHAAGPDGVPGTVDDDLRLGEASPCIDAGENAAVLPWVLTDIAGNTRVFDDPATPDSGAGSTPIVDMGAYEFGPWQSVGSSNILPRASFTHSVSNDTVRFTDTSTDDDGSLIEWRWSFGDLSSSTNRHPVQRYLANGDYPVTLTVRDNNRATDRSTTQVISITSHPPLGVHFITPLSDSTNTYIITLAADVTNTNVLFQSKFYVDGTFIVKDEDYPFAVEWDTRTVADGLHTLRVKATDGDQVEVSQELDVMVDNARTYFITPPFDGEVNVGDAFAHRVQATGDPQPVYTVVSGPEGLTIDPGTGWLDWTPTVTQLNFAVSVTVAASNSIRVVEQVSTLVVVDHTPPTAPSGIIATNLTTHSALLRWDAASDNAEVVAYQVWSFLKVNQFPGHWRRTTGGLTTGREFLVALSSAPRYTPKFSVSALDASGNESYLGASVTVFVLKPPSAYHPISSGETVEGVVGASFAYDINATGNPTPLFEMLVGPAGMTVDSASGLVAWMPLPAHIGEITATVRATNSVGASDHTFTFPVRMPQFGAWLAAAAPGLSLDCPGLNSNWSCSVEYKSRLMETNWVPLAPASQWPRPVSAFPYMLPSNTPGFFRLKGVFTAP